MPCRPEFSSLLHTLCSFLRHLHTNFSPSPQEVRPWFFFLPSGHVENQFHDQTLIIIVPCCSPPDCQLHCPRITSVWYDPHQLVHWVLYPHLFHPPVWTYQVKAKPCSSPLSVACVPPSPCLHSQCSSTPNSSIQRNLYPAFLSNLSSECFPQDDFRFCCSCPLTCFPWFSWLQLSARQCCYTMTRHCRSPVSGAQPTVRDLFSSLHTFLSLSNCNFLEFWLCPFKSWNPQRIQYRACSSGNFKHKCYITKRNRWPSRP